MTPPLVALVTGGASGIGSAIASKLASRGITVVIADRDEGQGPKRAAEIAAAYHTEAFFRQCDVTSEPDVQDLVRFAASITGCLDYAANCAGICETVWDEEESITTTIFDQTYAVNTKGLWLCQKYEAQQMQSQALRSLRFTLDAGDISVPGQRGSIANVASIAGLHAMGLAAYTPSKYAAIAVTKNGAKFYGPSGIRCNALCPGWTLTPMIEKSMGQEGTAGTKDNEGSEVNQKIGLRRMALPQEQANVLSFFLSDESSYLNGAVVVSDGGFHDIR